MWTHVEDMCTHVCMSMWSSKIDIRSLSLLRVFAHWGKISELNPKLTESGDSGLGAEYANAGFHMGTVSVYSTIHPPSENVLLTCIPVPLELFHGNSLRNSTRQYHKRAIDLKLTPLWRHSTQKLKQCQRQKMPLGKAGLDRNCLIMIKASDRFREQGQEYSVPDLCGLLEAHCNRAHPRWEISSHTVLFKAQ